MSDVLLKETLEGCRRTDSNQKAREMNSLCSGVDHPSGPAPKEEDVTGCALCKVDRFVAADAVHPGMSPTGRHDEKIGGYSFDVSKNAIKKRGRHNDVSV